MWLLSVLRPRLMRIDMRSHGYHLYHASRAELLRELGHPGQARAADRRALELTANPAEQAVIQQRPDRRPAVLRLLDRLGPFLRCSRT